ncbi:hypothetical protein Goklo_028326 [Gossypium klotzschianum]|uniref:Uncharacterized protein n=1 Tax=Gossypium klotzschianum TaxID=34286 RepID=A0A7J8U0V5_9ROSI|nr:hypothetical protein [Gossypium klotzschianum]
MRVSGLSASEVASNFSGIDRFGDSMWIVGFRSDSEGDDENENDNRALTFDLNSGDDYGIDDHVKDCCDVGANDDVSFSIPLFWDSLQLEDRWETLKILNGRKWMVGLIRRMLTIVMMLVLMMM